jgi:hypothetical protein
LIIRFRPRRAPAPVFSPRSGKEQGRKDLPIGFLAPGLVDGDLYLHVDGIPSRWADYVEGRTLRRGGASHRVDQTATLVVEADLVLFHPYDRWGFEDMGVDDDDRKVPTPSHT